MLLRTVHGLSADDFRCQKRRQYLDWVGAGGDNLHALRDDGCRQDGSGRGPVTSCVVCLRRCLRMVEHMLVKACGRVTAYSVDFSTVGVTR